MIPVMAVITVPAVPIVRPIIAIVRIRSIIAVRVVVAIWIISIVTRKSDTYSDRYSSLRTLYGNKSQ